MEVLEKEKDQYGRVVGVVYLNGENVNLKQVADGNAWWYRFYAKEEPNLQIAEEEAREKKLGLWKASNPIPPWEFRRKNRNYN